MPIKSKPQYMLFAKRITHLCYKWKTERKAQGLPYSDAALAEELINTGSDITDKELELGANTISRWKHGKAYPSDIYLSIIGKYFNIDPDEYFSPIYDWEKGSDKAFNDEKTHSLYHLCEEIDLSPDLVKFITSNDKLEMLFPFDSSYRVYMETGTISNKSPFQISNRTQTRYLNENDLSFIKSIQQEVVDYISFLMFKEKERIKAKTFQDTIQHFASILQIDLSPFKREVDEAISNFVSDAGNLEDAPKEAMVTLKGLQQSKGLHWHITKEEINERFSSTISPQIHKANQVFSGITDEELEQFYKECDRLESEAKKEYIKAFEEQGGIIDNGTN